MSGLEMSWAELRDRIIKAHKPIADHFFKSVGNHLQFMDSNIAERIMLHFAGMDAPAPVSYTHLTLPTIYSV